MASLPGADRQALTRFMTERLADDWLYQSVIRRELQALKAAGAGLDALEAHLAERLAALWQETFPAVPAVFIVTPASLDDPSRYKPQLVSWTAAGQPWDHLDPALPTFDRMPAR